MNAYLGFLPEARGDAIISKEADGELLIYDLDRNKAHCLNLTAAIVWKHCNGRRSVAELALLVEPEIDVPIDHTVIQLALRQLARDHLLIQPFDQSRFPINLSRRQIVRRLGIAAVMLPLITSISAPTALANASCAGTCIPGAPNNGGCPPGCTCSDITGMCVNV